MGTLFDQKPRQNSLQSYFQSITEALEYMDLNSAVPSSRTPAQWHAACDIVRTALAIQSADVLDEQLACFGELYERKVR